MIGIGVLGSNGRMGQFVCRLIREEFSGQATVIATIDQGDSPSSLKTTDVIIDFATPEATLQWVQEALKLKLSPKERLPALIIGSTGWTEAQLKKLNELSAKTAILRSANFSESVGILHQVLKQFSPTLHKLGYQPVLEEIHHIHKKDAPSGTALSLQKAVTPQAPQSVQTVSIRAGEVIGDHTITFYGPADQLSFKHQAQDRSIFARGAIRAALWLQTKNIHNQTGFFELQDYYEDL